jgi:ATP-binding cassette subfamily B protein/subfamily B ATP-binding cassette protein MsbA
MKNFLRALRFAWNYRIRLAISVLCALAAAACWSLNFTAIYPVLKIIGSEQNLHDWVETEIGKTQKQVTDWEREVDRLNAQLEEAKRSGSKKLERRLTGDIAKVSDRLEPARRQRNRYHILRDYLIRYVPVDRFQTLLVVMGLVVLGVTLKGIFEFGQDFLVGGVVGMSLYDLRNRFYRNVLHLDVNHFSQNGTSEMTARFTNDMEMLAAAKNTLFGKVVAEPLRAFGCVVVACWISWQLTFMFLVLVPIGLLILTKVTRVIKRAARKVLERMSSIYKLLQESFRGIRVVKAFTMEPYERRRFHTATKDYYRKTLRVVTLDALSGPVIELLGTLGVAAALLVGAYLVLNKTTKLPGGITMLNEPMETEALIQLYVLLAAIADPVRKLSNVYTRIQSGAAAADRIFNFYDLKPSVATNQDGPRLVPHQRGIEFRDICYSYDSPSKPALSNINLYIEHGETIALVGKNGSGKSTLAGLLPRFYDPDHGAVLIDGQDIREANLRSVRQQIGMVTQNTILFDDTIYNNIAYGNRGASREQVEAAARKVFLHDFISQLPAGYETRVGEGGATLSGGQAQRISLARAILRDPHILILDECTSQTDTVSEHDIHRVLRDFMRGRTTFVITHRLNTLEIANRIVVLENGRIEAVGTHAELLGTCKVYQLLHEAHFQRMVA